MTYTVTKTYGHERGFSCTFRQHRATHSHCSKLHGYALSFAVEFSAETLDERNWVQDFGGLKRLEDYLRGTFDHTLVVAEDDPKLPFILSAEMAHIADVVVLPAVGCEAFAKRVFDFCTGIFTDSRVLVSKVTVSEHGSNAASFGI